MKVRGASGDALRAAVTFRAVARRAGAEKGRFVWGEAKGEERRAGGWLGCAEPEGLRTAPGAPEGGASGRCIRISGIRTAEGSGAAGLMGARVDLLLSMGRRGLLGLLLRPRRQSESNGSIDQQNIVGGGRERMCARLCVLVFVALSNDEFLLGFAGREGERRSLAQVDGGGDEKGETEAQRGSAWGCGVRWFFSLFGPGCQGSMI
jgi:hypothetical protein